MFCRKCANAVSPAQNGISNVALIPPPAGHQTSRCTKEHGNPHMNVQGCIHVDANYDTKSPGSGAKQTCISPPPDCSASAIHWPGRQMGLHEKKLRNTRAARARNSRRRLESNPYEEGTAKTCVPDLSSSCHAMRAPLKTSPSSTNVRRSADLQRPNMKPAESITATVDFHYGHLRQDDTKLADRAEHPVAKTAPQSTLKLQQEPLNTSLNKLPVVKSVSHLNCQEESAAPSSDEEGAGVIGKLPTIGFASASRSKPRRKRDSYLFNIETQIQMRDLEKQLQVLERVFQLQFRELARAFGELQAQIATGSVIGRLQDRWPIRRQQYCR